MTAQIEPAINVSNKLKKILNKVLAIGLAVANQYMWQYVQLSAK